MVRIRLSLVSPPVDFKKTLGKLKALSGAMPPMGLAYLAATLRNDANISIIDAASKNLDIDMTVEEIIGSSPDIVGLSCLTPGAPICHTIAQKVKEKNPAIRIFFGGIHPTLMPNETLADGNVDFVVRGEGELTCLELIKALKAGSDLKKIRGISYRKGKKIVNNPDRDYIKDLDSLPFPAWDLFPLNLYSAPPHWDLDRPCFPMLASRGCPYRCTFCSLQITGNTHRARSAKNVVDEIEWLVTKFGAKEIMFMDATFPLDKNRGMEVCEEIIRRGLHKKMVWICETRVNHIDPEMLKKMREAGCRRVAFGIESGVQVLLNNIKKGFTLDQVRQAIKITKEAKLEVIAYFMLGLPGETKELSMQTIEFAKELDAEFVKFNLAVPYPGTVMYQQAVAEGTLKSMDWEHFTSFSSMTDFDPVYVPKGMTKDELEAIQKTAIKQYYMRPNILIRRVLKVRSARELFSNLKVFGSLVSAITRKKQRSEEKRVQNAG